MEFQLKPIIVFLKLYYFWFINILGSDWDNFIKLKHHVRYLLNHDLL